MGQTTYRKNIKEKKMSKRSKVAYSGMGGEEPSFLKAFKAKVGYQEPDNEKDMEAKKAKLDAMLNDDSLPDELPQVVSLGRGVTQEDAAVFLEAKAKPVEKPKTDETEKSKEEAKKSEAKEKTEEEKEEDVEAKLLKNKSQKVVAVGAGRVEKEK